MSEQSERYDLVIIGLGAAGTAAARMAASLELRVAVVERSKIAGRDPWVRDAWGRDAWSGSIPSNALIESARVAHTIAHAADVGVHVPDFAIDTGAVWSRVAALSAQSAAESRDAARLDDPGVDLFHGEAAVTGPHEVTVAVAPEHGVSGNPGMSLLSTRFVLVCTGSRPRRPDIPGLDDNTSHTTDTFWSLPGIPRSMVFIGGGPVSLELAQALSRLGVGCIVLERERRVLIDEEPALVDQLVNHLRADGVDIITGVNITRARRAGSLIEITGSIEGVPRRWGGEVALIATGRVPDIEQLGLAELGVVTGPHGIVVDERGRTSVRSIYAAGDAADPGDGQTQRSAQRRHVAAHHATRAVRDMFFPGRAPADSFVSSVLFTDPELAHSGLTTSEAEALYGDGVDVWRCDLGPNHRNLVAAGPGGEMIIVAARGRIVGAHVLSRGAGELISELALAIGLELKLADVAHVVHPSPTLSSAIGRIASDSSFELAKKLNWLMRKAR